MGRVSVHRRSWLTTLARFGTISFVLLTALGAALVYALRAQMQEASGSLAIRPMAITVGLGLFVVFVELLAVVGWGSRRLRLQVEHNEYLATHDGLTGLPNRMQLFRHMVTALPDEDGRTMWASVLNLVGFSEINGVMGHANGDQVLIEVSRRLVDVVGLGGFVARLAADEFVVVWFAPPNMNHEMAVRTLLGEMFAKPFEVGGMSVRVRGVVGVATAPGDAVSVEAAGGPEVVAEQLLRRADMALEAAQRTHQPHVRYTPGLSRANPERLALAAEVDRAMESDEFRLVYQPKVGMRDLRVQGVEALVRWHHPTRGLVTPDEFLPIIEQTDLIGPLTERLLDQALSQWRAWWDTGVDLPVAVNLSARNVADEELPARVQRLLDAHGAPPEALELELTESAVLNDPDRARQVLQEVRSLGVRLAVDDFGTGYASLAYLTSLPIDTLKIDQSFAAPVVADPRAAAIVRFTVDLARHLEMLVVAEGVEDAAAFAALAELGCDVGQGYWICRPQPGDELTGWLQSTHYGLMHRPQLQR